MEEGKDTGSGIRGRHVGRAIKVVWERHKAVARSLGGSLLGVVLLILLIDKDAGFTSLKSFGVALLVALLLLTVDVVREAWRQQDLIAREAWKTAQDAKREKRAATRDKERAERLAGAAFASLASKNQQVQKLKADWVEVYELGKELNRRNDKIISQQEQLLLFLTDRLLSLGKPLPPDLEGLLREIQTGLGDAKGKLDQAS